MKEFTSLRDYLDSVDYDFTYHSGTLVSNVSSIESLYNILKTNGVKDDEYSDAYYYEYADLNDCFYVSVRKLTVNPDDFIRNNEAIIDDGYGQLYGIISEGE